MYKTQLQENLHNWEYRKEEEEKDGSNRWSHNREFLPIYSARHRILPQAYELQKVHTKILKPWEKPKDKDVLLRDKDKSCIQLLFRNDVDKEGEGTDLEFWSSRCGLYMVCHEFMWVPMLELSLVGQC